MLSAIPGNIPARPLGRAELESRRFPRRALDDLFAAILIDDEVDEELRLPDRVQVDFPQDQLVDAFRLCRQLWLDGFDRPALARIAATLVRRGTIGADERVRLKHIRAKFKHFRYAQVLYRANHRYSPLFHRFTATMGHAQDAFRLGRRLPTLFRAAQLRFMLTGPTLRRLYDGADRLVPATPASFRALFASDLHTLEALLARPAVSGHAFHDARKVIGRQVSFWNTVQALWPSEDRHRLTRWLSAINGVMGRLHDELVERRAGDRASYGASFPLPAPVREWMTALNELTRAALTAPPPAP